MIFHMNFLVKWGRLFLIFGVSVPIFLIVFLGMLDEKMLPRKYHMPSPYSVIPLYPSRVPLLDLPGFTYIINNDVCEEKEIFTIIIVHSHPANRERRDAMRRNIPREDLMDIGVRRVFLLARAEWDDQTLYKRTPQDQISEENVIHRDIIQGNFKEHYHNLTYKHVMGLQWVNTFCSQAKYIIKMDDDIIVDIYRFRDILKYRYENRDNIIVGLLVIEGPVIRNTKSKWYVNEKEYAEKKYPNFMSGWAYAMSTDASKNIVNISQRASYFWIDDVFVTGILAAAAGVKREGLNRMYTLHTDHLKCCVELPKHSDYICDFMAGPSSGDVELMEKLLRHARNCFVLPCSKRPPEESLSRTCIITKDMQNLGEGYGEVIKVH